MQFCQYSTGGAAIHRLTVADYPGRVFSAYVDAKGNLVDAESATRGAHGVTHRGVKPNSKQWRAVARAAAAAFRIHSNSTGV